ncbi:MAG: short-chain dehydrogenase [Cyanobacteria bacterium RYN_339]|nr:short-chain dehydrogenase [Cyanobacteria bacterium RYN_339]
MGYFQDKVFLVTGASSGIGLAIAQAMVVAGARVALMARSRDKLEELRQAWGQPERVLVTAGDVTRPEDCAAAVAATQAAFGRLDGLVHSAGVSMRGEVAATDPAVFRQLMDINFHSSVSLIQAALPAITTARGHVVVISSVVGHFSPPYRGGYAASKHAVQALMDALRVEVLDRGVHVLTVCPGFVATNISLNALAADGSRYDHMDPETAGGLDARDVARDVLAAITARKREIAPAGGLESLGLFLARVAPALLDRFFLRRFRNKPL